MQRLSELGAVAEEGLGSTPAGATVQALGGRVAGGAGIVERAAEGVRGSGQAFPHRSAIESSFGLSLAGNTAHMDAQAGSAARSIGAKAYAFGSSVAFQSSSPSLHTAAHEAAHLVQQRAGVQLPGGVGSAGDRYERNADAVADAVVRGESAQPLLAPYLSSSAGDSGGGGGGSPSVQMIGEGQAIRENLASGMHRGNVVADLTNYGYETAAASDFIRDLVSLGAPVDHVRPFQQALRTAVISHVATVTNTSEFEDWFAANEWHLTRYLGAAAGGGNCEDWAMAVGSRLVENTRGQWVHTVQFAGKDHGFVMTYPRRIPRGRVPEDLDTSQAMIADGWWDNAVMTLDTALHKNAYHRRFPLRDVVVMESMEATGAVAHAQTFPPQVLQTIQTQVPQMWQLYVGSSMYKGRIQQARAGQKVYGTPSTGRVNIYMEEATAIYAQALGGLATDLSRALTTWAARPDATFDFQADGITAPTMSYIMALGGAARTKLYGFINAISNNDLRQSVLQMMTGRQVWRYCNDNQILTNSSWQNMSARNNNKPTMRHVVRKLTNTQLTEIRSSIMPNLWIQNIRPHLSKNQRRAVDPS